MTKSKADIIMANARKYGCVTYRADTMEPLSTIELGELIHEDMAKHFEADPSSMLPVTDAPLEPVGPEDFTGLPTMNIGVDKAVTGGDTTVYGRPVYDPEINQALQPAPHPDPLLAFLDDAIKRRAYGEFIPLPLFEAVMKMINTLPNTKLNHEHYPDTYSVAAALEELRRLRPFPTD